MYISQELALERLEHKLNPVTGEPLKIKWVIHSDGVGFYSNGFVDQDGLTWRIIYFGYGEKIAVGKYIRKPDPEKFSSPGAERYFKYCPKRQR